MRLFLEVVGKLGRGGVGVWRSVGCGGGFSVGVIFGSGCSVGVVLV